MAHIPGLMLRARISAAVLILSGFTGSSAVGDTDFLQAGVTYINRTSGAGDGREQNSGRPPTQTSVMEFITAPTPEVFALPRSEAYADESGTFWSQAVSGGLEPFEMEAVSIFEETRARTADSVYRMEVTGARVSLTDFGSQFDLDMSATITFGGTLMSGGQTSTFNHEVSIEGRIDDFTVTNESDFPGPTITEVTASGLVHTKTLVIDPFVLPVDLSNVEIGQEYTISLTGFAEAANRGGETLAEAWFRDPATGIGGIRAVFVPEPATGLLLPCLVAAATTVRQRRRQPVIHRSTSRF